MPSGHRPAAFGARKNYFAGLPFAAAPVLLPVPVVPVRGAAVPEPEFPPCVGAVAPAPEFVAPVFGLVLGPAPLLFPVPVVPVFGVAGVTTPVPAEPGLVAVPVPVAGVLAPGVCAPLPGRGTGR